MMVCTLYTTAYLELTMFLDSLGWVPGPKAEDSAARARQGVE